MNTPDEHLIPEYISPEEYLIRKNELKADIRLLEAKINFAKAEVQHASAGSTDYSRVSVHTSVISRQPEDLNTNVDSLETAKQQKIEELDALTNVFMNTLELLKDHTDRWILEKRAVYDLSWTELHDLLFISEKTIHKRYDAAAEFINQHISE